MILGPVGLEIKKRRICRHLLEIYAEKKGISQEAILDDSFWEGFLMGIAYLCCIPAVCGFLFIIYFIYILYSAEKPPCGGLCMTSGPFGPDIMLLKLLWLMGLFHPG